ncbi:MAG TPA: alpha/beta hydrolase [Candidatus Pelethocola excrementipullorum]|nr:alpha/beta hydrolase [Candidatus Pelethocola excrementipullorum]
MIHEKIIIEEKTEHYNEAFMLTYFWEDSQELNPNLKRPVILICPGGAYARTSDREAEAVALRFMSMGYHTAVLRYSVAPATYPTALHQLAKSVSILKEHSEQWLIEKDQIILMGFSAGGHLAASLGVFWNQGDISRSLGLSENQIQPAGMILCYPVISSGEFGHQESFHNLLAENYNALKDSMSLENQVNSKTPKTFLWHGYEDNSVPAENSLLFAAALKKHHIPVEYHLFSKGGHGLGLANALTADKDGWGIEPACEPWSTLAEYWLRREFHYPALDIPQILS